MMPNKPLPGIPKPFPIMIDIPKMVEDNMNKRMENKKDKFSEKLIKEMDEALEHGRESEESNKEKNFKGNKNKKNVY